MLQDLVLPGEEEETEGAVHPLLLSPDGDVLQHEEASRFDSLVPGLEVEEKVTS